MAHRATRVGITFLTAAAVLLLAGASAQAGEAAAKPIIAKIHADWCGTCTQLNPTMVELEKRVGGEAIVVTLDVSDKDAVARSAAEADRLGIRKFFDSYKSKTGTVGIIDTSGKIVQIYKGELDVDKYVSALERAEKEA
jgi:thiol-disulfide isomerase/thioredoxin